MALTLAAPRPERIFCVDSQHSTPEVSTLDATRPTSRLVPLATTGAIAVSAALPLVQISIIMLGLVAQVSGGSKTMWSIVATACYLPLHMRHVIYVVRGARPPGAYWTLAAMAVIILGALPLVGLGWLWALSSLAVSALLLLPAPWSGLAFLALVLAPIPLSFVFGEGKFGAYFAFAVAWRSVPFVLVWLAGAIRELEATRQALAGRAVEQERLRIDAELRRTLGAGLEEITDRGAAAISSASSSRAERELRELVAGARRTLADTRRMARGYQTVLLRSELDTAITLLAAAGIDSRVVVGDPELLETVDERLKTALRDGIAGLLQDRRARTCAITMSAECGRIRLAVSSEHAEPAVTEVAAT